MNKFILNKPDLSLITKDRKTFLNDNRYNILFKYNLNKYSNEKYLFWDRIKFLELPSELKNHEELWYIIKETRLIFDNTPIKVSENQKFKFEKPDFLNEFLHKLDLELGGNFLDLKFNNEERKIFLQNGSIEEAISSSQLEGSLTTSKVAREMIGKGRKAVTKDEKMILNNYQAMILIKNNLINESLSLELLLELQSILTKDLLENKDEEGRFRKNSDEIVVQDGITGEIYHTPPNEKELREELKNFIKYANNENDDFVHPFIKATILHFWIGYLHPFCDGNGRTARTIFYWYLLKKGYWGFNYIPISTTIKKTKKQYHNSFVYSEQDGYNFTYFLVYISNQTKKSWKEFEEYVKKKKQKQKNISIQLINLLLNDREEKLISYFLENKGSYTNTTIHQHYYGISKNTAKKDLENLYKKGFLMKQKQGKYVNYFPVKNLSELI